MLTYTITNGGTYSTDAYEYKYTTSITNTFILDIQLSCDKFVAKTFTETYYTASTLQLFHDGRESVQTFRSYKNNAPSNIAYFSRDSDSNCNKIGGYYRATSFTLKGYTIYESNGKRTDYTETVAGLYGPPRYANITILGSTSAKFTKPWDSIANVPVITTRTFNRPVHNTTTEKASFKSSFIKAGDSLSLVNFETAQTINPQDWFLKSSKTTEWIKSNKKEKTRLGYSYEGTDYYFAQSPSKNFNYADTVVFITNNNILWYITDYGEGEFTKKFKSTRGIGQQVTIKYNTSPKEEKMQILPIGYLPYGQSPPYPGDTEEITETTSIRIKILTTTKIKVNTSYGVFPLPTILADETIASTESSKFTTQQYISYKDTNTPTKYTTTYKTLLQVIKGNTLEFDRTYKDINNKISTFNSFVTYSFGEHTASDAKGGTTFKDEIVGYTSLLKDCYSINTEGGGEVIFNKGYINGQAAINNLSIVEQVSFKDNQTYTQLNAVSGPASLYQKVPLAFANFAKSFTFIDKGSTKTAYSPIEDTNLKLDLRYVLMSSSKEVTSSNQEKYTKIDTTKHEFALKGETPATYLDYRVNNLNNGFLVNPNQYCNLNNDTFNNMNCGIFCDDGNTKSFITRILYPGTYLAINIEGIKSSVIGKVVTLTQGVKSYYYLPWNGSIQSNGTLNLLSPSFVSLSHNIRHFLPNLSTIPGPH